MTVCDALSRLNGLLSRNSALNLSLDERKPWPRREWFEWLGINYTPTAGFQEVTPPPWHFATAVAARHIPASVEEGSFPAIFQFRENKKMRPLQP